MTRLKWWQKLISGLLVFFVGGVGSLTYFDAFLPNHDHALHPFHISIFEGHGHDHHHAAETGSPSPASQNLRPIGAALVGGQAQFNTTQTSLPPGLAQFLDSGLSAGYLLTSLAGWLLIASSPIGRLRLDNWSGRAGGVAPPAKPPSVWPQTK